jgi:NAD(P)-dependent dehydrogenase (short-subunit alcohol dehydrogenase family)
MTHALIVGGSKGTGKAVAEVFSSKSYDVSIISRTMPEPRILESVNHLIDLEKKQGLEETLSSIVAFNGPINYVVFCQRYRGEGDAWEGELQVSLNATKRITDFVSENLADGDKSFVMVSSIASKLNLYQQPAGYHVAKAGLEALMRHYAVHLGPKGVRVNTILPGTILKQENKKFYQDNPDKALLYNLNSPSRRIITAEEIAEVIDFLCSPKSRAVTGQSIIVDGGISLVGQESLLLKNLPK